MKTRNIFIWIMLIIGLTACSEEEINTYSADEGIYFNQRIRVGNILTDSTNFTFVYIEESQNEAIVSIPVQLVGKATDEPRPVNIKVVGGSAKEGDDFVLPANPVLPAGASSFNYEITLKRSTALHKITISLKDKHFFSEKSTSSQDLSQRSQRHTISSIHCNPYCSSTATHVQRYCNRRAVTLQCGLQYNNNSVTIKINNRLPTPGTAISSSGINR